jgi:hypothetical protein
MLVSLYGLHLLNLITSISSSSSLHGLGESPVPASSIVVSIFFLFYLCLVFRMVDIYMPVECGYVPFFADVLSIYSCILLFFLLKGKCPTHFLNLRFSIWSNLVHPIAVLKYFISAAWILFCGQREFYITGKPQNNSRTDPKRLRPGQHKNKHPEFIIIK